MGYVPPLLEWSLYMLHLELFCRRVLSLFHIYYLVHLSCESVWAHSIYVMLCSIAQYNFILLLKLFWL